MISTPAPCLYMAPLKGITDSLFMQVYVRNFPGLDRAMAPFVNPQKSPRYPEKLIADLLPEKNKDLDLVPQVLNSDAEGFIALGNRLHELGRLDSMRTYQKPRNHQGEPKPGKIKLQAT